MAVKPKTPNKPLPKRVPADGCVVISDDGVETHPHIGQSITIIGNPTVGEMKAFWEFDISSGELQRTDLAAEDVDHLATMKAMNEAYDILLEAMSRRIVDWDLTDQLGEPLPKPDRTPGPLAALQPEELFWVRRVLRFGSAPTINEPAAPLEKIS